MINKIIADLSWGYSKYCYLLDFIKFLARAETAVNYNAVNQI